MLRRSKRPEGLGELVEQLPGDLRRQAYARVVGRAPLESYERLAFLGDVVLSLAVSDHLFPRFERYGAGRLTKVRAQAVSEASCARVARDLGVPERLREGAGGHRPQRGDARGVGAGAGVGVRGADRRRLPLLRHRARPRRWSPRSPRRSTTPWSIPSTTSRCSRSGWRAGRRWWPIGSPPRRARTTAVSSPWPRSAGRRSAAGKEDEERRAGAALQALDGLPDD